LTLPVPEVFPETTCWVPGNLRELTIFMPVSQNTL